MTYGPAIECNGKRPEWLGDDDFVFKYGGHWNAKGFTWDLTNSFRLRADHPYYRATDAMMLAREVGR